MTTESLIYYFAISLLVIFGIPFFVYLLVKMAMLGYYRARQIYRGKQRTDRNGIHLERKK